MAYVGTASNLGNDQDTLRSVVLGEAGGEGYAGQLAVADVIQNRANAGGFGGSTMAQVATAPNQFQGQADLSQYSPSQIASADKAIAAAQGGQDITGGATYYANPGASSAAWARGLDADNSLQIGNHYFTDNTKGVAFQPTGNVGAGAAGTPGAAATSGGSQWPPAGYVDNGDGTMTETATGDTMSSKPLNIGPTATGGDGGTGGSGTLSSDGTASGLGAAASGALGALTGSKSNAGGIVAAAENWFGDLFVRAIVIILGLVLVIFALVYFRSGGSVTVNSIARTVKKHPLLAAA